MLRYDGHGNNVLWSLPLVCIRVPNAPRLCCCVHCDFVMRFSPAENLHVPMVERVIVEKLFLIGKDPLLKGGHLLAGGRELNPRKQPAISGALNAPSRHRPSQHCARLRINVM